MQDLLDCNVGLLIGYDCSQALTPREVIASKSNEPHGIRTDLGWSIVGTANVNRGRSFCHRVAVKEVPVVTMGKVIHVLESDFHEKKDGKMASQEDLQFLKIMEEEQTTDTTRCHYHLKNHLYYLTIAPLHSHDLIT